MTDAERIAQLEEQLRQRDEEIELLKGKLDLVLRKLFGSSSEKIDPDQLQLLLDPEAAKKTCAAGCEEDAPVAEAKTPAPRSPRRRKPGLPEDLPVVVEEVEPEEVRQDPAGWRRIGEEVSERLEFEPARYWMRRTVRGTWVTREHTGQKPVTAAMAPCLLEGSLLTPSLGAHLLSSKYCDHLPYYRQEQILRTRHGIKLGRNTMCHWTGVCADRLEPLYKLIAADLREQNWLHVDETPIDYLAPGNGKTKQGYFWTYRHPKAGVLYNWHTGRAHQCLDTILLDPGGGNHFRGTLVTDGYGAYETWQRKQDGVTLAACWAHVRRKFHEALPHHPAEIAPIMALIGQLFAIEATLRKQRAGPGQARHTRQEQSQLLVHQIKERLTKLKHCLPKSTLGKARNYALGLWTKLEVFLDNGEIPLDNNPVENAIRPTKLGAKNWMFIGNEDTGWRSAVIYTLVENIRQGGGDPYAYLKDVLTQLPRMTNQDDLRPLLPASWLATQRANRTPLAA